MNTLCGLVFVLLTLNFVERGNSLAPPSTKPLSTLVLKKPSWIPAEDGEIPPGALKGGSDIDGEDLYVARARHRGSLLPGKLVSSHSLVYVAWNGREYGKTEYEVLCGVENAQWVQTVGGAVPRNALPAGNTEDGETLYVCRASHEGSRTIGKTQSCHSVCYIPFHSLELTKEKFEVLVKAPYWTPAAGGEIPSDALKGGYDIDGQDLYVARARHEGALIPGKLLSSHHVVYVPWDMKEIKKDEYEVLCGAADAKWVQSEGGALPPYAFPAGNIGNKETLYVCRASHKGSLTIGKFRPEYKVCFIPFHHVELTMKEFEVLVV